MKNFVDQEIVRIRKLVGDKGQVLGAVSGGVDSTVAAKLMHEAIGDRFYAVFVDNGCLRLNECEQVQKTLIQHLGINLVVVDASQMFLNGLKGIEDPEEKRKFIGGKFIDIFEKEAKRIEEAAVNSDKAGKIEWFMQGTLYTDVIEVRIYLLELSIPPCVCHESRSPCLGSSRLEFCSLISLRRANR
jgi:GMP synthase (glutamine-hydrolysing)